MNPRQQRYSQLKQEFCRLKHTLKQEIYLFRECRNFIVEIDVKYLVGILSNLAKMFNMTINYWVDYIRMNFFLDIVYKKRKIFGPDEFSRRKWYLGNSLLDKFKDGLDNEKEDILILLEEN